MQTVGGLTFYVAQSEQGLTISTVSGDRGINFGAKAATAAEAADVLLMVLSLTGPTKPPDPTDSLPSSVPSPRNK